MFAVSRRALPLCVRLAKSPLAFRSVASAVAAPPQFDSVAAYKNFHPPHSHGGEFRVEKVFCAVLGPLFTAGYFMHTPGMDWALTAALTLYLGNGVKNVLSDYGRPFVLGEKLAPIAQRGAYLIALLILAGLIHFNLHDVGLTKAFEAVWSL